VTADPEVVTSSYREAIERLRPSGASSPWLVMLARGVRSGPLQQSACSSRAKTSAWRAFGKIPEGNQAEWLALHGKLAHKSVEGAKRILKIRLVSSQAADANLGSDIDSASPGSQFASDPDSNPGCS
jgi:hypothetical protein